MADHHGEAVVMLESLLDDTDAVQKFHYVDYYDHNNIKVIRGIYTKSQRMDFLLPDNPESAERDWWLMYAVNALCIADAASITRYLRQIKYAHKELFFTVDDQRIIARRLNMLCKMGFLTKYLYVAGTSVDIDDAQQAYDLKMQQEKEEFEILKDLAKPVTSLDDDYLDEDSSDEIDFANYSTAEYSKHLKMKKEDSYIRGKHHYAVLNDNGNKISKYFGKGSSLVMLYGIEEETWCNLRDRFGSNIPTHRGSSMLKLASEQIGDAAIGFVASKFCVAPTFRSIKNGLIQCRNGRFFVPVEMEFRKKDAEGNDFSYHCGIFKSYYNEATGRTLPQHDKGRIYDTISNIKNYLGVKGITKTGQDSFVIIVVNDTEDLHFFVNALMNTTAVNAAEVNRIFFTGEGIVKSNAGIERVIGIKQTAEDRRDYSLYSVKLPIV